MKTTIHITGQIYGNAKLRSKIITADCEERRGMFYSYILTFSTKKAATKALSDAYQSFCSEMPEEKGRLSGFRYARGHVLYWDASKAEILDN